MPGHSPITNSRFKISIEKEMHETAGYIRVTEPGRRIRSSSNIRTMLIIGGVVAVLCLVLVLAVAIGVRFSNKKVATCT